MAFSVDQESVSQALKGIHLLLRRKMGITEGYSIREAAGRRDQQGLAEPVTLR